MSYGGSLFTLEHTDVSDFPLFVPLPDTDFRDYLDGISAFAESHPDIIASIEADQDQVAFEKKQIREADKKYSTTSDLPPSARGGKSDRSESFNFEDRPAANPGCPRFHSLHAERLSGLRE